MKQAKANKATKSKIKQAASVASRAGRRTTPRQRVAPAVSKQRITIALDVDVVEEFQRRAAVPGALPYQTQMNAALREYVFGGQAKQSLTTFLQDEQFLQEIAKRVKQLTAAEA
jgi:uncharacterized protein (DUF4415 family)